MQRSLDSNGHRKPVEPNDLPWEPIIEYPENLPITAHREAIIGLIRKHPVVIVAGETGSGKTTQLPKLCLEAGQGRGRYRIGCTQPRRVAAFSVSERIAEELQVPLGDLVGCKVRFDDRTTARTRIQVMTDGILLAEVQADPLLRAYDTIIIDEAHERSLNIDFLIGYLRLLRAKRPDLKIILTSATINTQQFSEAFDGAPVVTIEGRTFPVEVFYEPLDERNDEITYIEAAAQAVRDVINLGQLGDILVFFPGERDIREVKDLLERMDLGRCEILPLFGRLTQAEQHKIFTKSSVRKIILATNIAETSITIPEIRTVIDTGLVRISRYSSHTRTQRLPIEPISQSSAKQRQGRAGRVAEGVCIRLYSEKDFLTRPVYATPEIARSNLAEVILKMIAFRLGDIETFPFLEPPNERSVRAGFKLLRELRAMDTLGNLTPIGHELARLPIDPTVGRMLLQARKEHAVREVLVIAAALSIQDPRERPFEAQELADAAHRRFVDPMSDFLTLLNLWEAYHEACENLSQKALRRFCKTHYLSYIRMREWRDVHTQLRQAMMALGAFRESSEKADYRAIHRSLLVGLLSNVAQKERGNTYQATHSRRVLLFPGSGLFDRRDKRDKKPIDPSAKDTSKTPTWIMCAEWMETSQLFAHTVAQLDPTWVAELGSHLTKSSYADPHWDSKAGRVLAREKIFLHGLLVHTQLVGYSSVDPEKSCEIFIREGLVPAAIKESFAFLKHNSKIYQLAEDTARRLRLAGIWDMDERLYQFYAQRIRAISSIAELYQFTRSQGEEAFYLKESDLIEPEQLEEAARAYPTQTQVGKYSLKIDYHYEPGSESDGATLHVPLEAFGHLDEALLDRVIPGYLETRIENLLRSLPKDYRKQLLPLSDKLPDMARAVHASKTSIKVSLQAYLKDHYSIVVDTALWPDEEPHSPLRLRISVHDANGHVLGQSRELEPLYATLREKIEERQQLADNSDAGKRLWLEARQRYEKPNLINWTVGDISRQVEIGVLEGIPLTAYPGLALEATAIALRLFKAESQAQVASVPAYRALLKTALADDWKFLIKDLNALQRIMPLYITLGSLSQLKDDILFTIERHYIQVPIPWPMRAATFDERVNQARSGLRGLPLRLVDILIKVLQLRHELLTRSKLTPFFAHELEQLAGGYFIRKTPLEQFPHLERYLKALKLRIDRAIQSPQKEAERQKRVKPWLQHYTALKDHPDLKPAQRRALESFRWLVEEYKVSIFAQELGTAEPVSEKRLAEARDAIG